MSSTGAEEFVVHIGYHKTGSSWLQSQVFPAAAVDLVQDSPAVIEELVAVNPFGFDPRRARRRILAERSGESDLVVVSMERLSGHPDSGGFDARVIADRLLQTFAEARVLIVIRRQEDMMRAVYGEYVRTGGAESLRRYLRPLRGAQRRPRFDPLHLEYDRLIAYYQDLCGPERVRVLAYEQLRVDPARFAREVTDFCGVPPIELLDDQPVHPSMSPLSIGLKRRLNLLVARDAVNPVAVIDNQGLADRTARAVNWFDRRIPKSMRRIGAGRNERIVAKACRDRFQLSNRRTAAHTGLDLEALGYSL